MLGSYDTGLADIGEELTAGEVVAVRGERMYVANASDVSVDIVDIEDPASPRLVKRVDLSRHGAGINSIDVSAHNLIAVALEAEDKTDPGTIAFLTPAGKVIRTAEVGALPDMVTFTPDGRRLLVANEGEPDCYGEGCTDPVGSVSVVTVVPMRPTLPVATIGFDGVELPAGVRVFGPGASAAQDLEPEYITVSADGRSAWVSLQENNAIAALDLEANAVREVFALGYKDHGVAGAGLDASDREISSSLGAINIQPWSRVKGMYQPDALASFTRRWRDLCRVGQRGRCAGLHGLRGRVARAASVYHGKLARLRQHRRDPGQQETRPSDRHPNAALCRRERVRLRRALDLDLERRQRRTGRRFRRPAGAVDGRRSIRPSSTATTTKTTSTTVPTTRDRSPKAWRSA